MGKYLTGDFPFGGFIDVYGLLARFVSKHQESMAKEMEVRSKVFLSSSEEILLNTFRFALPLIFGKVTEGTLVIVTSGDKTSMLPGVKNEHAWCAVDMSLGVKICIKDQMETVLE